MVKINFLDGVIEMRRVIVLAGIIFLLGLAGCNSSSKSEEETKTVYEVGECRPMFS